MKNANWAHKDYYLDFIQIFDSLNTRDTYRVDLAEFFLFVKGLAPDKLTLQHFIDYRDFLIKVKSPSTVNRKMSSVKSFMKWCVEQGVAKVNQAANVKVPKRQVLKPTQALMDSEAKAIINMLDGMDQLMAKMMLYLALRKAELLKIRVKDFSIQGKHNVLIIHGKGGKVRQLPLSKQLLNDIKCYIQDRDANELLFPVSRAYPYRLMKRCAKKLKVERDICAHSARATAISHLLDTQKTPIRDVADFAGHSSVTTTMLYDKKRKGLDDSAAYDISY